MPIPAEDRPLSREPRERQGVADSTCYMCACRCDINVTLENGRIRFIQGNPEHPVNRGVVCAKGAAGIMKQLSPAKLYKPLRREPGAERGRGEFEEIEWDEALALLTARLAAIRAFDPRELAFFTGCRRATRPPFPRRATAAGSDPGRARRRSSGWSRPRAAR